MGGILSHAFIPPDSILGCDEDGCLAPFSSGDWVWGLVQVLLLMMVYAYILFTASNMLSIGSELLLLVPSIAGIVGSVVLPILGAVPDGAIMLFSGLGPDAQHQLSVGVGALAGSTIMLLTVPWGAAIIAGRVGIGADGLAQYGIKKSRRSATGASSEITSEEIVAKKLGQNAEHRHWLEATGVSPGPSIKSNAFVMVATSLVYLVIQGPAWAYATEPSTDEMNATVSHVERWWAMGALLLCLLNFTGYLFLMVQQTNSEESTNRVDSAIIKAIQTEQGVTLSGVLYPMIADGQAKLTELRSKRTDAIKPFSVTLLDKDRRRLAKILEPFFHKYDRNGDGRIDLTEMHALLADLHEPVSHAQLKRWMTRLDPDQSGYIETAEFVDAMLLYITAKTTEEAAEAPPAAYAPPAEPAKGAVEAAEAAADAFVLADEEGGESTGGEEDEEGEEGEEEEDTEVPEDLLELGWQEQQWHIKARAAKLMGVGTIAILLFADPMVDVLANVGARVSVPPFYVAFVLAPLASNAAEFIASYNYATKKTKKTITVSLAALEGAACMNNTFCLAIFMGLVFFKQLAWKFSAETIAVLIVELGVGILALRNTMELWVAALLLAMFPASIVFIAALEATGID